jgi:hypothetical protein
MYSFIFSQNLATVAPSRMRWSADTLKLIWSIGRNYKSSPLPKYFGVF